MAFVMFGGLGSKETRGLVCKHIACNRAFSCMLCGCVEGSGLFKKDGMREIVIWLQPVLCRLCFASWSFCLSYFCIGVFIAFNLLTLAFLSAKVRISRKPIDNMSSYLTLFFGSQRVYMRSSAPQVRRIPLSSQKRCPTACSHLGGGKARERPNQHPLRD